MKNRPPLQSSRSTIYQPYKLSKQLNLVRQGTNYIMSCTSITDKDCKQDNSHSEYLHWKKSTLGTFVTLLAQITAYE